MKCYNNNQNNVNTVPQAGPQVTYGNIPPVMPMQEKADPNNGMAVGSLVCGIIAVLSCLCCGIGATLGIAGLILALMSKKKNGGRLSGVAVGGLVCSILGIVFSSIYWIYYAIYGASFVAIMMDSMM